MIKRSPIIIPRRAGKTWLHMHLVSDRLRTSGDHHLADLLDRALADRRDQS
jgi:hypothetical protein